MADLDLRINLHPAGQIGAKNIQLLERIDALGSISAASRAMNMTYRAAWLWIEQLNRCLGQPVVATQMGGHRGGGARLTDFGRHVVAQYRSIQRKALNAVAEDLAALQTIGGAARTDQTEDETAGLAATVQFP